MALHTMQKQTHETRQSVLMTRATGWNGRGWKGNERKILRYAQNDNSNAVNAKELHNFPYLCRTPNQTNETNPNQNQSSNPKTAQKSKTPSPKNTKTLKHI